MDQLKYLQSIDLGDIPNNIKLYPRYFLEPLESEIDLKLIPEYQNLIGQLGWCAKTLPAIAFIFSHFSQYSTKPSPAVLRSLKRAIQYCKENCSSIARVRTLPTEHFTFVISEVASGIYWLIRNT
jgi:hypothetical protein